MNAPSPHWYQDPQNPALLRWWDGTAWTEHTSPRSPTPPAAWSTSPSPYSAASTPPPPDHSGRWYFVITVLSGGSLTAVPFFHAASRLDRPELRKQGAVLSGLGVIGVALGGAVNDETVWSSFSSLAIVGVVLVACLMLISVRREVYQGTVSAVGPAPSSNDRAVAGVTEARRKRAEARALAAEDPMMARELGIGRPASPHPFEDGGLVDLNAATAQELSDVCGLSPTQAHDVVEARCSLGRFLHVEDAVAYGRISEDDAALLRDRGIIINEIDT